MDIRELIQRMGENLSVARSFGTAYEHKGTLVIPVALVAGGGGGGEGTKGASPATGTERPEDAADAGDTGSGGGFGGVVLPVGVYVVKDDQVRWVPAINVTLIALASFSVLRLMLRVVGRHHRRH